MEEKLAGVILGEATSEDKFTLTHWKFKFNLSIKPISGYNMMRISSELSRCTDNIDNAQTAFQALVGDAKNIKHICNCISIATGTKYRRIVSKIISKLSLEDIAKLWNIVERQSNADFFLHIMASATQLNILKPKEKGD